MLHMFQVELRTLAIAAAFVTIFVASAIVGVATEPSGVSEAREHFEKGLEAEKAGNFAAAIEEFEQADEAAPKTALVAFHLAQCYRRTKETEKAINSIRECLTIDEMSESGLETDERIAAYELFESLAWPQPNAVQLRRINEARAILERAIETRTGLAEVEPASILARRSQDLFQQLAIELPDYAPIYGLSGRSCAATNAHNQAIAALEKYIAKWGEQSLEPPDAIEIKVLLAESTAHVLKDRRDDLIQSAKSSLDENNLRETARLLSQAMDIEDGSDLQSLRSDLETRIATNQKLLADPHRPAANGHLIRYRESQMEHCINGQSEFRPINGEIEGSPKFPNLQSFMQFQSQLCTLQRLHVFVADDNGVLWHAMRAQDGQWRKWENVSAVTEMQHIHFHAIYTTGFRTGPGGDGDIIVGCRCVEKGLAGTYMFSRRENGMWQMTGFEASDSVKRYY